MSDKLVIDKNGNGAWVEEKDVPQSFEIDDTPRLMILSKRRLSCQAVENIQHAIKRHKEGHYLALVFEPEFDVFQLINGRWQPIKWPEQTPK